MSPCSTLPEVLVSSTSYILYMSMYREILTDALLRDRNELQSVGQCCPLVLFVSIQPFHVSVL